MADWLEIPNFPNHLVCKVDDNYYVKSKKRMKGKRLGIESWGVIGGNILKENKDGKVTVRANSHSKQCRLSPEELYKKANC